MTAWQRELAATIGTEVMAADRVTGGDINEAFRVRLADGRVVFVKTHARPPPGMFATEAAGLAWLSAGDGGAGSQSAIRIKPLRVPHVLAGAESFLALEWIDIAAKGRGFDEALGRGLAALHRIGAPAFGLDQPSYLATLRQDNRPTADGVAFWIEQRVRPLAERAIAAGAMPDIRADLDRLRARPDRFGPSEPPARLHGDLWWGNVIAEAGAPVLIDPAVYGGHREVDLAMLALFGGVPPALIAAYHEVFPLADGWRDRVTLWQLYPLAAHAVLFGGGYGAQVARTLATLA